jgi:DNA segregation ATPase FtsK/SpoIIIE-like protein
MLALSFFLFFALVSQNYQGIVPLDDMGNAFNLCGKPGAYASGFLYILVGYAAHVLYFLTCVWALMLFCHRPVDRLPTRLLGTVILTAAVAGLLHLALPQRIPGGIIGARIADLLAPIFGMIGSYVITITLSVVGILLSTEFLFIRLSQWLYRVAVHVLRASYALFGVLRALYLRYENPGGERPRSRKRITRLILGGIVPARSQTEVQDDGGELDPFSESPAEPAPGNERDLSRIRIRPEPAGMDPVQGEMPFDAVPEIVEEPPVSGSRPFAEPGVHRPGALAESAAVPVRGYPLLESLASGLSAGSSAPPHRSAAKPPLPRWKTAEFDELPPDYVYPRRYKKPPLDILDSPPPSRVSEGMSEMLRQTSVLLERALQTFDVEARVTDVTRGPTITRFELEPAPGTKVNRFVSLADDLALALKAHGVRVEAPIPGKGRVGIELPNAEREPVMLRDLLESRPFRRHKGKLVLALGKDIAGEVVCTDLTTMPHLLIAGATGTGKTICVKSLLASLLFMNGPEEVQLMLIDPKMVELSILNDIPHLITPVVTDPKKAASALNWLIVEMEERYRLFAQLRVRNIEVYNESVENNEIEIPQDNGGTSEAVDLVRKLPYIVCVIDELADLMMLARAEVEDAIMRLAQLARAVGIHLIIATQRPSVNVLTGVIKANFAVRISFQVSSRTDSRCILDEMGAERLIGRGDMLYLPAGKAVPTRIQGAFVSDHEMNSLIAYLKTQAPPQYRDEIERFSRTPDQLEALADETDDLFDDAVRVVLETGQASISMVQRRLRVGYTRAARLIDMMEVRGIVGPHVGSKARDILVDFAPADRNA